MKPGSVFKRKPAPDLIREPAPDLIRGGGPVRVKKTRQLKNLEPRFVSIETEKASSLVRPKITKEGWRGQTARVMRWSLARSAWHFHRHFEATSRRRHAAI